MNRPVEVLRARRLASRERFWSIAGQSERTLMLGTILLASAVSAATAFVFTQYYAVDALSSLVSLPQDCFLDWRVQVGRHCFSDYALVASVAAQPNPWGAYDVMLPSYFSPLYIEYPAAGLVPHLMFGTVGEWLGAPRVGLIGYLVVLTAAVLAPAVWASRGPLGLERVVVFVALGAVAIPAWAVIDRGNSAGFVAAIGLVFLVALRRQRWALVGLMVVLAAVIKPQFVILAVALLAARQWRWGAITLGGVVFSNLAAYLLWPRDFPNTIAQSIDNALNSSGYFQGLVANRNVSFAKGILQIPDYIAAASAGGRVPEGFLLGPRLVLGYVVLIVVVVCVLALGRRIPPVMVGIALLATASLFPALSGSYYLVFVLPVAALVARDPDGPPGSGIFDRLALGDRRRAVGICVSLAAALSIAQIAVPFGVFEADIGGQLGVPGVIGTTPIAATTVALAPILWLIACAAIIVSYTRTPAPTAGASTTSASGESSQPGAPQKERRSIDES